MRIKKLLLYFTKRARLQRAIKQNDTDRNINLYQQGIDMENEELPLLYAALWRERESLLKQLKEISTPVNNNKAKIKRLR
jgi:hypothetical protein